MSLPSSSLYQPLDPGTHEIRILKSLAIDAEDRVTCDLLTVPLGACPPFTALSYVWGDSLERVSIRVNGQTFLATENLASALRYIPRTWKAKFPGRDETGLLVWADAVCINQGNYTEKGHQVQLMKRIFSDAELVMCWMPSNTHNSRFGLSIDMQDQLLSTAFGAFELISRGLRDMEKESGKIIYEMARDDERLVRWLEKCPELQDTGTTSDWPFWEHEKWLAISYFFKLEYWERVWILQEITTARSALLFCKSRSISWGNLLVHVLSWFISLSTASVPAPSTMSPGLWNSLTASSGVPHLGLRTHVFESLEHHSTERVKGAWKILSLGFDLRATQPKDYIYGLLSVTGIDLKVDYSKETSLAKVFRDVTEVWLQRYQESVDGDPDAQASVFGLSELWFLAMSGLSRNCATIECQQYSSWAPNPPHFKDHSFDVLLGLSVAADRGVFSHKAFRTSFIRDSSLIVTGLVIDSVHHICVDILDRSHLLQFISDVLTEKPNELKVCVTRRRFLRDIFEIFFWSEIWQPSIITSRNDDSSPASDEYLSWACAFLWEILRGGLRCRAMLESLGLRIDSEKSFYMSLRETFLDVNDVENELSVGEAPSWAIQLLAACEKGEMPGDGRLAHLCKEVDNAFKDEYPNRDWVVFQSSRGLLGLARRAVALGDIACILRGYTNVVVLREEGDHYFHVGGCRIGGMMDGEAAELLKNGTSYVREFEIR